MRKLLRLVLRLVFLVAVVVGAVFGGAYTLPNEAKVERHVSIPAAPEKVAPLAFELRNYPNWLAWKDQAPDIAFTASGSLVGAGQKLMWRSTSPLFGDGVMESVAAQGNESMEFTLEGGPFASARMLVAIAPIEGGTGVTWSITMPNDGIMQRWQRYYAFEPQLAPSMVKSLANLRARLEQTP